MDTDWHLSHVFVKNENWIFKHNEKCSKQTLENKLKFLKNKSSVPRTVHPIIQWKNISFKGTWHPKLTKY